MVLVPVNSAAILADLSPHTFSRCELSPCLSSVKNNGRMKMLFPCAYLMSSRNWRSVSSQMAGATEPRFTRRNDVQHHPRVGKTFVQTSEQHGIDRVWPRLS